MLTKIVFDAAKNVPSKVYYNGLAPYNFTIRSNSGSSRQKLLGLVMRAVLCAAVVMLGNATRSFFSTKAIYRPTKEYGDVRAVLPKIPNILSKMATVSPNMQEVKTVSAHQRRYAQSVSFVPTSETAQIAECFGLGWWRAGVGAFFLGAVLSLV